MDYRYHDAITNLLAELDPEGLIYEGAPLDEYEDESFAICGLVFQQQLTPQSLCNLWQTSFGPAATVYKTENDPQLLTLYMTIISIVNAPPPILPPDPRPPVIDTAE